MSCGGAANLIFIGVRLRLLEGPGLLGARFKFSGGGTALFDGGGALREVGSAAPGATVVIGTTEGVGDIVGAGGGAASVAGSGQSDTPRDVPGTSSLTAGIGRGEKEKNGEVQVHTDYMVSWWYNA